MEHLRAGDRAPQIPRTYLIQNGRYQCVGCDQKVDIRADGTLQPVTGANADHVAVTVLDPNTIETVSTLGGKVVGRSGIALRGDGKSVSVDYIMQAPDATQPRTGHEVWRRMAKGPAGAHALSGTWQRVQQEQPTAIVTFTYRTTTDQLTYSSSTGDSYTARFDGKEYPVKGPPDVTSVIIRRVDDRTPQR